MSRHEGVNVSEAPAGHRRPVKPPPAPPLVQGVTGNAKEKKAGTKRQQRRRERLREQDIKEVTAKLGPVERAMLDESRIIRGGIDGPYDVEEYIAALVREDAARLKGQIADSQRYPCNQCGKTLPAGCGGAFKGELACLHTPAAWRLRIPTVDV